MKTYTVELKIDLSLLEDQLKFIGELINGDMTSPREKEKLEGIWNMGHEILDQIYAEMEETTEDCGEPDD